LGRPNHLFRRGVNDLWSLVLSLGLRSSLPSEGELGLLLNLSRGTVRSILEHAKKLGVIDELNSSRYVKRRPTRAEYFDLEATISPSEAIEREFMSRIQSGAMRPNERFSELQLARDTGASTAAVREFLIGFSQSGLVEKQPKGGWLLRPLDEGYIRELAQMRALLELAAFECLTSGAMSGPDGETVNSLIERHLGIEKSIDERFTAFPSLDRDFHAWIMGHFGNRFAAGFLTSISAIFHFHYQMPRSREKTLNAVAIAEHLVVLKALKRRDFDAARAAFRTHLDTSLATLLSLLSSDPSAIAKSRTDSTLAVSQPAVTPKVTRRTPPPARLHADRQTATRRVNSD